MACMTLFEYFEKEGIPLSEIKARFGEGMLDDYCKWVGGAVMNKVIYISEKMKDEAFRQRMVRRAVARQNLAALCSMLPPAFNPKKYTPLEEGLTKLIQAIDESDWNKRKKN